MKKIHFYVNEQKPRGKAMRELLTAEASRRGIGEAAGFDADVVVALGGDGTILRAVHEFPGVPVLGLNLGGLGYLSSVGESDFTTAIAMLAEGRYRVSERSMLEIREVKGERAVRALNDVVIVREMSGLVKATGGTFNLYGKVGMVFQDPMGSLNPRQTIRAAIETVPRGCEKPDAKALLEEVGLDASALDKYPHEFSGGQRQRICTARALAMKPELLICDEAVSALDLSIRAQVLDLLGELKKKHGLSFLFITHDIGVVQHIADSIIVMNHGNSWRRAPATRSCAIRRNNTRST